MDHFLSYIEKNIELDELKIEDDCTKSPISNLFYNEDLSNIMYQEE